MSKTRLITLTVFLLFITFLLLIVKNTAVVSTSSAPFLLVNAIKGENRLDTNKSRDIFRHPRQTLTFFGITPDMTVVEVWPGKGWYTEILAPYMKQGKGQFIAAGFPQNTGPKWRQNMQRDYQQWLEQSPDYYDQVKIAELGPPSSWEIAPNESIDAILTFRNVHNWLKGGYEVEMFTSFFNALKPGGILGVTDHRAKPDTELEVMKKSGYLTERLVIELAEKSGFILEETSEINANPLDSADHPKGVWTLPPTMRLGGEDKKSYLMIGESDRMTLRFRKPISEK